MHLRSRVYVNILAQDPRAFYARGADRRGWSQMEVDKTRAFWACELKLRPNGASAAESLYLHQARQATAAAEVLELPAQMEVGSDLMLAEQARYAQETRDEVIAAVARNADSETVAAAVRAAERGASYLQDALARHAAQGATVSDD